MNMNTSNQFYLFKIGFANKIFLSNRLTMLTHKQFTNTYCLNN